MAEKIFVAPAYGLKVADPVAGDYLPEEGREVAQSTYWLRRIKDGDVRLVKKPAPPREAKAETAKTESKGK